MTPERPRPIPSERTGTKDKQEPATGKPRRSFAPRLRPQFPAAAKAVIERLAPAPRRCGQSYQPGNWHTPHSNAALIARLLRDGWTIEMIRLTFPGLLGPS